MGNTKKLWIYAGPNGSGKSSLFEELSKIPHLDVGHFSNADLIEKELSEKGFVNLADLDLQVQESAFAEFDARSTLKKKALEDGYTIDISFNDNFLVNNPRDTNSYEAAYVAAFLRQELIKAGKSFSFETVMSHASKLEEIRQANKAGYKTYLYYVSTESPLINKDRVEMRVQKGGHTVNQSKINSRYASSLDLLYDAIQLVHRAYLFDNSGKSYRLVSEFYRSYIKKQETVHPPKWVQDYVLKKMNSPLVNV